LQNIAVQAQKRSKLGMERTGQILYSRIRRANKRQAIGTQLNDTSEQFTAQNSIFTRSQRLPLIRGMGFGEPD
jgi:hypothetical protein